MAQPESASILGRPEWLYSEPKQSRYPMDPEGPHREATQDLRRVMVLRGSQHKPQRWGYAIIRTAYGPQFDDQFRHALHVINSVGRVHCEADIFDMRLTLEMHKEMDPSLADIPVEVDTRPNEELERRFQNDVLEDASALDNADVPTVRNYFIDWINGKNGTWDNGNVRFASCILLDAETLAHLQAVPDDPNNATLYWVKVVEAELNPVEAYRVRVFGRYGLAKYWLWRNYTRRSAVDLIHERDDDDPSIRYYGHARKYGSAEEQAAELLRQYEQLMQMTQGR